MRCGFFAIVSLLAPYCTATASTIPNASFLQMEVSAAAFNDMFVVDTDKQSQNGSIDPLAVSVSATSTFGAASVTVFGSGSAVWVDPSRGEVIFPDVGWTTQNVLFGDAIQQAIPNWSYTFTSDGPGVLTMAYHMMADGSPDSFGLDGAVLGFNSDQREIDIPINGDIAGTLLFPVVTGVNTATLHLITNIGGNLGTREAVMDASFSFDITTTPIPEPPASTLLFLSLGALGLLGRGLARPANPPRGRDTPLN